MTEQSETGVLHEDPEGSTGENSEDPTEMASAKYGNLSKGPPGVSGFLQKRLQKGQKFFDSGDYNVAKQMKKGVPVGGLSNPASKRNLPLLLPPIPQDPSGQPMPVLTPEDLPHHTHPHEPSKLVSHNPTN